MRLVTCALALSLAFTPLTTRIADACGGSYGLERPPQVMLVSHHALPSPRAFVVMSDRSGEDTDQFTLLAPRSFDNTLIMEMGSLSQPASFTLVGTEDTRVVTVDRRVALKHALLTQKSNVDAMEIPVKRNERFAIALHGNVRDAKWHAPEWLAKDHIGLASGVSAHATEDGYELRANGSSLGTHGGQVHGLLEVSGKRYIVMQQGTRARLIKVPARS